MLRTIAFASLFCFLGISTISAEEPTIGDYTTFWRPAVGSWKMTMDADGETNRLIGRIHRAMADDNRERRERLRNLVANLMADASYFAAGQRVEIKSSAPLTALDEALEYLIDNTFPKMAYLA